MQADPYQIGKVYLIRTVTMYYIGKLIAVYPQELVLEDAIWVVDTGRFSQAVTTGKLEEIEPFATGNVLIGRGSLVDASVWAHPIPAPSAQRSTRSWACADNPFLISQP